jgi:hypothetical protein
MPPDLEASYMVITPEQQRTIDNGLAFTVSCGQFTIELITLNIH